LDISKNINLEELYLNYNSSLQPLDVSHNINLVYLDLHSCSSLTSLYMKNGVKKTFDYTGYDFRGTNLNHICCNEDEIEDVKTYMQSLAANNELAEGWQLSNLTVTSDCGNEDLEVGNVTDDGATLSWSAVSGATSYTIEYRKFDLAATGQRNTIFAEEWIRISGITATTYTLSGLADNSTYEWRLIAVGSGDETPVLGPSFTTEKKPMGTEEISSSEKVALYPNPVKDVLYFSASGKATQAEIYDLNGRLVKTAAVSNNSVNVSSLSKGVYFIILRTDKGTVKEKFIKN